AKTLAAPDRHRSAHRDRSPREPRPARRSRTAQGAARPWPATRAFFEIARAQFHASSWISVLFEFGGLNRSHLVNLSVLQCGRQIACLERDADAVQFLGSGRGKARRPAHVVLDNLNLDFC